MVAVVAGRDFNAESKAGQVRSAILAGQVRSAILPSLTSSKDIGCTGPEYIRAQFETGCLQTRGEEWTNTGRF